MIYLGVISLFRGCRARTFHFLKMQNDDRLFAVKLGRVME